MYPTLVALLTAALSVVFWFDNVLVHPVYKFWWVLLVAGYLVLSIQLPASAHRFLPRSSLSLVTAVLVGLVVWIFDDVMTIYVAGVLYLLAWSLGCYAAKAKSDEARYINRPLISLVAIALILLPVSVNRILVKLPNLSAGTSLTLYESDTRAPDLDARFYNLINDHLEIEVYLGSQIYPHQPHQAPKLKIETSVPDVVVRLLSVSYQHRLLYLDMPLFELTEDELLKLALTDDGAAVDISRDRTFILLTGFTVGEPVWLQLPHIASHAVSPIQRTIVVFFRVLVWLIFCFAIAVWAPRVTNSTEVTVGA